MNNYYENPALSRSDLVLLLESPARFKGIKIDKTIEQEPSLAMVTGSIFHCALLEPHKLHQEYLIFEDYAKLPSDKFQQLKGRRHWQIVSEDEGMISFTYKTESDVFDALKEFYATDKIILPSVYQNLSKQISGLINNPMSNQNFMGNIESEKEIFGTIFELPMKAKLDAIVNNNLILDYKSTGNRPINDLLRESGNQSDVRLNLQSKMWSEGLDLQVYIYSNLLAQTHQIPIDTIQFKFVFQHNSSNDCAVIVAGKSIYDLGEKRTNKAIEIYNYCMSTNNWPSFLDNQGRSNLDTEFNWEITTD